MSNTKNLPAVRKTTRVIDTSKAKPVIRNDSKDMQKAWAEMTEVQRQAADITCKHMGEISQHHFRTLWTMGNHLRKVRDNEEKYGENCLQLIGRYVGPLGRGMMHKAIAYATVVPEAQLKMLIALRTKATNRPLTWQHMEKLITVKDDDTRSELAVKAAEQDWTPEELQTATFKARGVNAADKNKGGRKVIVPPTPMAKTIHMLKFFGFIIRNAEIIYEHKEEGFENVAKTMPADKITPELLDQWAKMIENCRTLEDLSRRMRHDLDASREVLRERMNAQAEKKGTEEADKIAKKDDDVVDAEFTEAKPKEEEQPEEKVEEKPRKKAAASK